MTIININAGDLSQQSSYEPVPAGTYSTTVFDVTPTEVKSGDNAGKPQYKIQLRISEGQYENRRLFTYVPLYTGKAFWKTQSFFTALGYDMKDGQFKVPTPAELSGKAISAKVTIVDGLNGEDNNVAGFAKGSSATATLSSMGATPVSDAWV
jgi:hypothetical protein